MNGADHDQAFRRDRPVWTTRVVFEPHTIPNWTRTPVIGFSQVGYHPSQPKRAVIELDANDTPLPAAS